MFKFISVASALLIATSPVIAQTGTAAPATGAQTPKVKDPNRIICQKEETLGTRLGARKVCKTAQEWQDMRAQHRDNLEGVQRQATSTGIPAG
jgi:hypothetical protein